MRSHQTIASFLWLVVCARRFVSGNTVKTLIWSDEFDGPSLDTSKWAHMEWAPGVVNNELQAYTSRPENSRVENGHLIIECRYDSYAGYDYSSARLWTRIGWTYGRFEARIKVPSGLGTWPAFWMFPNDPFTYATTCDASTGWDDDCDAWPNSGELDILEHVGYEPNVIHASAHTKRHNFRQGSQFTNTMPVPTATTDFHVYAMEWRANKIEFFVDEAPLLTVDRNGKNWETFPFDHDFHFILNLAFGGDWGGLRGIDNTIFNRTEGVKMEVDYVRAYSLSDVGTPIIEEERPQAIPGRVETEAYVSQDGVRTEATSDTGGGFNVGYLDAGDWMEYAVDVTEAGDYILKYRVAGFEGGVAILLNGALIDDVTFPATTGWQDWTTVTSIVTIPSAGVSTLRIDITGSRFNLNYLEFDLDDGEPRSEPPTHAPSNEPGVPVTSPPSEAPVVPTASPVEATPAPSASTPSPVFDPRTATDSPMSGTGSEKFFLKVEAESFSEMNSVAVEDTTDIGGGQNVGWLDGGSWMIYPVDLPYDGEYTLSYRVAGNQDGGHFRLDVDAGAEYLDDVRVGNTGGWQSWTTITNTVSMRSGPQNLGIYVYTGGFNINFFTVSGTEPTSPPSVSPTPRPDGGFYLKVEAEDYSEMNNVQIEDTTDVGGGQNVGWLTYGSWMIFPVSLPYEGEYAVSYRVAADQEGGHFRLDVNAGAEILDDVRVQVTGGWQSWTTITHTVSMRAGSQNLGIYVYSGGFNINHFEITGF